MRLTTPAPRHTSGTCGASTLAWRFIEYERVDTVPTEHGSEFGESSDSADQSTTQAEPHGSGMEGRRVKKNQEPRLAVLIDADNTSAKWAEAIFHEVARLGEASVRRIYGDFSGPYLRGWEQELEGHAVIPHQQFAYTQGKNSSDIALVIDAIDLLHTGRFDGFVLVSSDSDFTRLASRIREQGLPVYGIGKNDTPRAFRRACKQFIFIENLMPGVKSVPAPHTDDATQESTSQARTIKEPPCNAVPLIEAAMRSRDEDWVPLMFIGQYVREADSEFDPRTYGCEKLGELLEKTGQFDVNRNDTPARARMKRGR